MRLYFKTYNSSITRVCYTPKLGISGKYYCGRKLNIECSNRFCVSTNGYNCANCMKLDIRSRNLTRGWLVNSDGVKAKKGSTGLFYCGQYNLVGIAFCDGYCGPNNGPNCNSCKQLDSMTKMNGIYKDLI
jgi:hypothetical protein